MLSPYLVLFCLCGVCLAIAWWILAPPREKWPMGLQAIAFVLISCVWVVVIRWLLASHAALSERARYHLEWTLNVMFFYMPLPIAVLGARFCWRFFRAGDRRTKTGKLMYGAVAAITFAMLLLLSYWALIPKLQKVRDAAFASSPVRLPAVASERAATE